MLRTRIIPALLLNGNSLVKSVRFKKHAYIGDPVNTVKIFNELEVDELVLLDIGATINNREPNFEVLREITDECFMPLAYGGGIKDFATAKRLFSAGVEKIILNSATHTNKNFVKELAEHFGNQAIVVSVDVKKSFWGKYEVWSHSATKNSGKSPVEWAMELVSLGAGEILLTSVDCEGTWSGFDGKLIKSVTEVVNVPVIAHGGAGTAEHIASAVKEAGASAVALGSMMVYQQKGYGVLINFPNRELTESMLGQ